MKAIKARGTTVGVRTNAPSIVARQSKVQNRAPIFTFREKCSRHDASGLASCLLCKLAQTEGLCLDKENRLAYVTAKAERITSRNTAAASFLHRVWCESADNWGDVLGAHAAPAEMMRVDRHVGEAILFVLKQVQNLGTEAATDAAIDAIHNKCVRVGLYLRRVEQYGHVAATYIQKLARGFIVRRRVREWVLQQRAAQGKSRNQWEYEYVWSLPWCVKAGESVLSPRAATRRLRYHAQKHKHRTEVAARHVERQEMDMQRERQAAAKLRVYNEFRRQYLEWWVRRTPFLHMKIDAQADEHGAAPLDRLNGPHLLLRLASPFAAPPQTLLDEPPPPSLPPPEAPLPAEEPPSPLSPPAPTPLPPSSPSRSPKSKTTTSSSGSSGRSPSKPHAPPPLKKPTIPPMTIPEAKGGEGKGNNNTAPAPPSSSFSAEHGVSSLPSPSHKSPTEDEGAVVWRRFLKCPHAAPSIKRALKLQRPVPLPPTLESADTNNNTAAADGSGSRGRPPLPLSISPPPLPPGPNSMHRPSSGAIGSNTMHRPSSGAIGSSSSTDPRDQPLPLSTQLQMQALPEWAVPWLRFRVFFHISTSQAQGNSSNSNGSSSGNGPANSNGPSNSNGSSSSTTSSRGTSEHMPMVVPVCASQYYHDRLFTQLHPVGPSDVDSKRASPVAPSVLIQDLLQALTPLMPQLNTLAKRYNDSLRGPAVETPAEGGRNSVSGVMSVKARLAAGVQAAALASRAPVPLALWDPTTSCLRLLESTPLPTSPPIAHPPSDPPQPRPPPPSPGKQQQQQHPLHLPPYTHLSIDVFLDTKAARASRLPSHVSKSNVTPRLVVTRVTPFRAHEVLKDRRYVEPGDALDACLYDWHRDSAVLLGIPQAEPVSSPSALSMSLTASLTFHADEFGTQSLTKTKGEVEEVYDHPCPGVATFRAPLLAGMSIPSAPSSSTSISSSASEDPRTFELRLRAPPKSLGSSQKTFRTRTMAGLDSSLLTSSVSLSSSVSPSRTKRGQGEGGGNAKTGRGGASGGGRGGGMGSSNRLGATTRARPTGK